MNLNPIKQIYNFNKDAGLLDTEYNAEREAAYPIEEALETFTTIELAAQLDMDPHSSPKDISRRIVDLTIDSTDQSIVNLVDKHLDIIVFSFGSLFKLGLSPQDALSALGIVMNTNTQKLRAGQDEHGKQRKPDDFIPPEEALTKFLSKRNLL